MIIKSIFRFSTSKQHRNLRHKHHKPQQKVALTLSVTENNTHLTSDVEIVFFEIRKQCEKLHKSTEM